MTALAPGDSITQTTRRGAHPYTLAEITPHVTRKGAATFILHWRGDCARCGTEFTVTSGRRPSRWLTRTCPAHRGRA